MVVWFRRDLRVEDHGAIARAVALAGPDPVVGLYVHDRRAAAAAGPNRRWFVDGCVAALDDALQGRLVQAWGAPLDVVPAVAAAVGASHVVVSGEVGPYGRRRDQQVAARLDAAGRRLVAGDWPYAAAPGSVLTGAGLPYRVFTPYSRAWQAVAAMRPVAVPDVCWLVPDPDDVARQCRRTQGDGAGGPDGDGDRQGGGPVVPPLAWWEGLPLGRAATMPEPGEAAAAARLAAFAASALDHYHELRDRPDLEGTSRLSPYLHAGCLHPRTALAVLDGGPAAERFATELCWREFAADVLWHTTTSAWEPLVAAGRHVRVDDGPAARERFAAWATGTTGFALADAGMRQLLAEGWMHNRVRMVSASVLVKDLHLDWRWGARWFLWHLVDGDLASNNHGWQWVAGVGTDAAPFHRVFNPERQQERFDPAGAYVARYLADAVDGGRRWAPVPIVDHDVERREALARWEEARRLAAIADARPAPP